MNETEIVEEIGKIGILFVVNREINELKHVIKDMQQINMEADKTNLRLKVLEDLGLLKIVIDLELDNVIENILEGIREFED